MSIAIKESRMAAGDPSVSGYSAMPGIGYVQGDPGLFGGIKTLIGGAAGIASRFGVPGASIASSLLKRRSKPRPTPRRTTTRSRSISSRNTKYNRPVPIPVPGIRAAAQRFFPGGQTGMTTRYGVADGPPGPGYHLNKSSYHLKDGTFVEKGTVWIKNRRRNPLNPRALDRAIGRISSAKRATKRLGRVTVRKACGHA